MNRAATLWSSVTAAAWAGCVAAVLLHALPLAAQEEPAEADPADPPAVETTEPSAEVLPKLVDMQVPSAEELLTGNPRDWIVLKNSDVIVCEPVTPRPDTLAKRAAAVEAKTAERRGKTGDELDRIQQELEELRYLVITLPGEMENPEYRIEIQKIDRIIHHEDQMLQRIDALVRDGTLDTAFELLLRLQRTWTDWPGVVQRHNNLLFADGGKRLAEGKPESALVPLTELFGRAADHPGLRDRIGTAIDQIVAPALAADNLRMARYFLFELDRMYSGHPVFQQHAAALSALAEEQLVAAAQARQQGNHAAAAELAEQATRIWPRTPNLATRYKPFAERYQRLRVGVVNLATDPNPSPYPSPAQVRAAHLADIPLFELDRYRNGTIYYRTRYFDEWEPVDLGRRLKITLRQSRQPWESQPVLDAPTIAALIEPRLNPRLDQYDERLAGYIESVRVLSPVELEIRFLRVPARVEPLLDDLVPYAPEVVAQLPEGETIPVGGFLPAETSEDRIVFRRAQPEPDGLPQFHVAEVIEHRYHSHEKALQALRQGEVSMLPDLPDWIIRRITAETDFQKTFFVEPYAIPQTHVIQFNPQSPAVRVREMRRAMLYVLDREAVLRNTVLRDPRAAHGRVVTSPFPVSSSGNSPDVPQRAYDLSAAIALALAAAQQLNGELPELRMLVPAGPVEQAAAADLVRAWRRIGLTVTIIDPADAAASEAPVAWDLHYRTLHMVEPTVQLWPFLTTQSTAVVNDLDVYPDWLKQKLIQVDRTSDWGRALDTVRELHEMLWSEVRFIPLWEVDGFMVVRKNIQGFPTPPVHCYQNIDRWTMQAYFPTE